MGRDAVNKKVLVAMSGGIDSSIACYLLKKKGYQCIGATIKTRPEEECGRARSVAHKLGVPHYVFDFSREFNKVIKEYFIREYENGRTPNPCVYCNSEIKFGLLLKKAKQLGCRFVSSGHYARNDKAFSLKKGKDKNKDQSYFLFNLTKAQLKHILFPIGNMTKEKVKETAKKIGLKSYNRQSSRDVCFKKEIRKAASGNMIFNDGRVLGKHKGISHYTIGQRKGLGIAYTEPLYVTKIDSVKNAVYIGTKSDTYKKILIADKINWISGVMPLKPFRVKARIRYGTKEAAALITPISKKGVLVEFDKAQASPTPGQAIVFYGGDEVLGGGWIRGIKIGSGGLSCGQHKSIMPVY
ncbi:MAG: tRNA 2-thiouridine(34) synthase MnmA [Candidatus Omnitrophica bacterium]|nr:tRNA 2-thiouridine(34) synthase MnmA [Candidatus Omnitrophota bacterium]